VIAVVDYGAGNLTSVGKALAAIGADFVITRQADDLERARGVIVPGVGNFEATRSIEGSVRRALLACVDSKPVLGVCLGLQYLFEGSEEAPDAIGLRVLKGQCFRLPPTQKVPHVGWNTVEIVGESRILAGVPDQTAFYFTHSYAAPVTIACVGRTTYTAPFAAVVEADNVSGVQFHPEKSGDAGLRVLRNFLELTRC
jgi:imidazole glycerol-phosphate synthase subunit HisH